MEQHISVMKKEALEYLNIKQNGIYVDATLGAGGHTAEMLKALHNTGHVYAFDQDQQAITLAEQILSQVATNYTIISSNFRMLQEKLAEYQVANIDGILFDIGVSSMQFDQEDRGFSYRFDTALDMRMDQSQKLSAYEVVNEYDAGDLTRILYKYGEEPFAKKIAHNIITQRQIKPIATTFELIEVIRKSIPMKKQREKHPAKKVFQAIRIEVNSELEVFEQALHQAMALLKPQGRLVVITFHSLEDKICKNIFNQYAKKRGPENEMEKLMQTEVQLPARLVTRKPITANAAELLHNRRAKSAKLRVLEKI